MTRPNRVKVLPARIEDVHKILAEGLREQDIEEQLALGANPSATLLESFRLSPVLCFTIHVDGHPAGVFGACPSDDPDVGIAWMVGTPRLLQIPRALVAEGRVWIDFLNKVYPTLMNWVDERNTVSVRWLQAMGFTFPHTDDFVTDDGVVFKKFIRCA